jgi:UDPglucose 6-dehydrogenase
MSETIAVVGLWHLGTVTAAVMAEAGHNVLAFDDAGVVAALDSDRLPVSEPGLAELWHAQRAAGRLRTTENPEDLADVPFVWICYDTPLDAEDRPDVAFVRTRIERVIDILRGPATVAVSSQMPVGSIAQLEAYAASRGRSDVGFAAIPENLRLGGAIAYLRSPDRFVVGTRHAMDRERVAAVLRPLAAPIVSIGVESAEMTKHALNAFLATSVVFANEIAAIAERVGADAREIEEGLKSDVRIGRRAYVRAGEAFSGGTLARDIGFLLELGKQHDVAPLQIDGTSKSNEEHKLWLDRSLSDLLSGEPHPRVALLGLTYKPGTDTLRSSAAVALAARLAAAGIEVVGFDPAISSYRPELSGVVTRVAGVDEALRDADVAVLMTPWPEFSEIAATSWLLMRRRRLVDPQRFLEASAAAHVDAYVAFGRPPVTA